MLVPCWSPRGATVANLACRILIAGSMLAVAGCANTQAQRQEAAQMRATQPVQTARAPQTELEADGLPPQVAPPRGRRIEPDDPREPFSPNYGNPPPSAPSAPVPVRQRADAAAVVPQAGANGGRTAGNAVTAAPPAQQQRVSLGARVAAAMQR